ncbi:MAG TPA: MauE/DoxX family redox-associated membrane protein [Thermoleophilaceae bacterium]|nr:MauE/DoxX family redox-associated membrane protein [Thermoleophilaceae bacterium]
MNGIEETIELIESAGLALSKSALHPTLIAMIGVVFLWSGTAKARSPWISAFAIAEFGITRQPRIRVAKAAALGELGIAGMLLTAPAVSSEAVGVAAGIATLTLLAFSLLIMLALRAGKSFACACFGDDSAPLTSWTLIRSCMLVLVAAVGFATTPASPPLPIGELALSWCGGAGLLATGVLLSRARQLARLPLPGTAAA